MASLYFKEDFMTPDIKDVLCDVSQRLTVLVNLFTFCASIEFYGHDADFRKETFDGLVIIIDDCIDKLKALEKQNK
jgi:hypothetical protein